MDVHQRQHEVGIVVERCRRFDQTGDSDASVPCPPHVVGEKSCQLGVGLDEQKVRTTGRTHEGAATDLTGDQTVLLKLPKHLPNGQWRNAKLHGKVAMRRQSRTRHQVAPSDPVAQNRVDPPSARPEAIDHPVLSKMC